MKTRSYHCLFLSATPFSCLAVQESKLDQNINDTQLLIPSYQLFWKDRNLNGGGVALYVHTSLSPTKDSVRVPKDLELICVQGSLRLWQLLLASIYRPPNLSVVKSDQFYSNLSHFLASLGNRVSDFILMGDFNICALLPEFSMLSQIASGFNLHQMIMQPTHGNRLIDHIYVGDVYLLGIPGLGLPFEKNLAGHFMTYFKIPHLPALPNPKTVIESWNWKDADWPRLKFLVA